MTTIPYDAAFKLTDVKILRIHACMRALHPDKRGLGFTQQSVETVVAYFETHFHDTSHDMLLAMVEPSDGDLTWAALSLRDRSRDQYPPEVPTTLSPLTRRP